MMIPIDLSGRLKILEPLACSACLATLNNSSATWDVKVPPKRVARKASSLSVNSQFSCSHTWMSCTTATLLNCDLLRNMSTMGWPALVFNHSHALYSLRNLSRSSRPLSASPEVKAMAMCGQPKAQSFLLHLAFTHAMQMSANIVAHPSSASIPCQC